MPTQSETKQQKSQRLPHSRIRHIFLLSFVLIAACFAFTQFADEDENAPGESLLSQADEPSEKSSFDVSDLIIPENEIFRGGPPKDGIPALTDPEYVEPSTADYLTSQDRVIGIEFNGEARAYPLRILDLHEVVNDQLGEIPFAVTYCPLCDSSVVFDRRTPLGVKEFGVSGLLYNSNVLMYDRSEKFESLWSQLMLAGVSGDAVGNALNVLPCEVTTWDDWKTRHPQTLVLSNQNEFGRNYDVPIYETYFASPDLMFPVNHVDKRLPRKTPVLAVWTNSESRAYPTRAFATGPHKLSQQLSDLSFQIEYTPNSKSLRITNADKGIHWMYSFWFAWAAFHPESEIYEGIQQ